MDARNWQSILYQRCPRLESERTAETVRRILPELIKLHSCESRATARPGNPRHEFDGLILMSICVEISADVVVGH
jgi:hypothetical protein